MLAKPSDKIFIKNLRFRGLGVRRLGLMVSGLGLHKIGLMVYGLGFGI